LADKAERLVERAAELALSKKAEYVVSLDLRGLSSSCDFFLICHGMSDVQVKAIADAIRDGIRDDGEHVWHTEGYEARQWILLDYVDVVVNVFEAERRDYYQLERLWGDAPRREFKDEDAE
jgi:ribosome-associated protein